MVSMRILKAFVAGVLAVVVFHQGAVALLYTLGVTQRAPFATTATAPLGVPQVVSLAFWGGVWGVMLWPLVTRLAPRVGYWLAAILLGAILPSLVAWFVVAPLKGQPVGMGWQTDAVATALVVNAAWGFGLALVMRLAKRYHIGELGRFDMAT